ncbi:hypothetical protein SPONL_1296 [uncultured Candidatus Thioglobus sp.]|nr:hypothetical protein SPONL_1296 [uncultured Candidatus Thioglobus sp.]
MWYIGNPEWHFFSSFSFPCELISAGPAPPKTHSANLPSWDS